MNQITRCFGELQEMPCWVVKQADVQPNSLRSFPEKPEPARSLYIARWTTMTTRHLVLRNEKFAASWPAWLVLSLLFSACAWTPRSASNSTAAPEPHAPAPVASNNSAAQSNDAAVQYEAQGEYEKAEVQFAAACQGGHLRACVRNAGYHILGLGPFRRDEARAAALLRRACTAGDLLACTYEVMLCGTSSSHCDLTTMTAFNGGDWDKIQGGCAAGSGDACLLAGMKAIEDRREAVAATYFSRACGGGTLDGCLLGMIATTAAKPYTDSAKLLALLSSACGSGDGEGCAALATIVGADNISQLVREKETEALLEQSCSAQPSQYYIGSISAPGQPMVGGSCAMLVMLMRADPRPGETQHASDLAVRACQLGVVSLCKPDFRR